MSYANELPDVAFGFGLVSAFLTMLNAYPGHESHDPSLRGEYHPACGN